MGLTGADVLHELLLDEGVEVIFGFPGGAVLPIFDVLYDTSMQFMLTRHEQGAVHMADGYARSTGKVGVVLATSGPGATNLVTGLATANMDSVPIVAITGQVRSSLMGNDAFQEADTRGITRPVTKHNALVARVEDLGRIVREAFHIARTGRPGPVLVDITVDAAAGVLAAPPTLEMNLPGYEPTARVDLAEVAAAAEAINAAKRPVLMAGGGVIQAGAEKPLVRLAEKASIPVTTTLLGLGSIDEQHPLALKMLGMHGTAAANYAVQECDCLISVGARFDDRVTGRLDRFAPGARIVHIDIDPTSIGKNVPVDVGVVGDAAEVLGKLAPRIRPARHSAWVKRIRAWRNSHPLTYKASGRIKPQEVIERLGELTRHDAIVVTGVGQHQMWAAQHYGWRRRRQIVTSGGLGTMGFGAPAAIGAAVGNPRRTVIDIDGDGSFSMTMVEILTAVTYNVPVRFIVLNNGYLGMVRQWQELFYDRRYSGVTNVNPSFADVARALGAHGITVTERKDLDTALGEALACRGPVVVDVHVEPEENVYPMVAAGRGLHEMQLGKLA
ncbi:MAG: biosynthetic-type acetolactate synthase large subunit [Planctomycetota bacterium]